MSTIHPEAMTTQVPEEADDALEAFNDLELQLARLRRQRLIPEEKCTAVQQEVIALRDRLENYLHDETSQPHEHQYP